MPPHLPLPRLRVSDAGPHGLATADGEPSSLLGDTAWELFHQLTRAESAHCFARRAAQGFNQVCAVLLAEFDRLHQPNAEGARPLWEEAPAAGLSLTILSDNVLYRRSPLPKTPVFGSSPEQLKPLGMRWRPRQKPPFLKGESVQSVPVP